MPTTEATATGDVVALTRDLVRRPRVTPDDAGCQQFIAAYLERLGFTCEHLRFGAVDNLWARRGTARPLFAFAGHTDVVPTGPEEAWSHPPFAATVADGRLWGRGVADMKGSLAAMLVAIEAFVTAHPDHPGSIALLITSDEEGPAVDGTRRVVEVLRERGELPDWCVVGEPSATARTGDLVRHGRRGSLNARLTVRGVQGHVAYPEQVVNPIHGAAAALAELAATVWDEGNAAFPPTSFQVSNISAGTGATNVVPGTCEVLVNWRFSTESTAAGLRERTEAVLARHGVDAEVDWALSGEPFLTHDGALLDATSAVLTAACGEAPVFSTGGGTSDGRFIAPAGVEVVELGPPNATIHQVDEHLPLAELEALPGLYQGLLEHLLLAGEAP